MKILHELLGYGKRWALHLWLRLSACLRRADLQGSEEETQQKGIGCHRCCGICRGNSGDHSDRPDTDAALTE